MRNGLCGVLLLMLCAEIEAAPTAVSITQFAKLPEFTAVKISPDGKRLAVGVDRGGALGVAVLNVDDLQVTATAGFGKGTAIPDFWWVGPNRLVLANAEDVGPLLMPLPTGELWAIDADGGRPEYLMGWRGRDQVTGTLLLRHNEYRGFARMVEPMPKDPDHALIAAQPFTQRLTASGKLLDYDVNAKAELYRLNVYNGMRVGVALAPVAGPVTILADPDGVPRYATGYRAPERLASFVYVDGAWKPLQVTDGAGNLLPLALDEHDDAVDLSVPEQAGRHCLEEQPLSGGSARTLACDPVADLHDLIMDFSGRAPLAAVFLPGYIRIQMLHNGDPDRLLYAAIAQRFPDELAVPVSHSLDGNRVVFQVRSDRDPGRWFLYDRATNSLRLLIQARPWIEPRAMPARTPIEFESDGGVQIHGFLTLPQGTGKNLPMVVLPHGGPFDIEDTWFWDADAALLASHGYAVLQVNFRGSGGYGAEFRDAGRDGWGTTMIDDILAGIRWAIAQGYADARRVCIYGASYGGYAALMSVIRAPGVFRCAVGYDGIYDLNSLLTDSDIKRWQQGPTYVHEWVGENDRVLREQSPITHATQIRVPVLLVHGEEDPRAPFAQAQAMAQALRKAGVAVTWEPMPQEGHGLYGLQHRVAFYRELLDFLQHNLQVPTPAAAAP